MFSVPHLVVLFIVVLVFFGPHKLPELARGLGKLMAEFRKASNDFKMAFEEEMRTIERQAREAEWKKSQEAAEAKRQADLATSTSALTAVADPAMEGKILAEPAANSESSHSANSSEPLEPIVTPVKEAVARDSFHMHDEVSAPAAAELPAEEATSSDSVSGDLASASDNSPSGSSPAAGPIHDQPHDQRQPA
jgi:sec-independent protein translocase protein TatB